MPGPPSSAAAGTSLWSNVQTVDTDGASWDEVEPLPALVSYQEAESVAPTQAAFVEPPPAAATMFVAGQPPAASAGQQPAASAGDSVSGGFTFFEPPPAAAGMVHVLHGGLYEPQPESEAPPVAEGQGQPPAAKVPSEASGSQCSAKTEPNPPVGFLQPVPCYRGLQSDLAGYAHQRVAFADNQTFQGPRQVVNAVLAVGMQLEEAEEAEEEEVVQPQADAEVELEQVKPPTPRGVLSDEPRTSGTVAQLDTITRGAARAYRAALMGMNDHEVLHFMGSRQA